ncbi:MAG: acetoacetate--CoA ligase [Bacteroidota bacterium]
MSTTSIPEILWQPSEEFIQNSNLKHYLNWLETRHGFSFDSYEAAWQWSVDYPADFWKSLWEYFEIKSYTPFNTVISGDQMPDMQWFEGSTLNYAEHIFRKATADHPAIIFRSERHEISEMSWESLTTKVASMKAYLASIGVRSGDRVVAYLPNIPEASIAFLAACSLGAIWSSCSPDFGSNSVIDRFSQIEPKVLFAVDGYQYGGKVFSKVEVVNELIDNLPTLERVVYLPYLDEHASTDQISKGILWDDAIAVKGGELTFESVPFGHPIWVLYSSGTTGIPKAITHSHGGVLLEHLKYVAFHNDVKPGERFFWFSTTGWMMWNFVQASLLGGATIVLYDGSPGFPDMNVLWDFAEKAKITHFGTSAPFIVACMKKDMKPGTDFDLSAMRSIGSTGSPLPPDAFAYVYEHIKNDLWLCSMAGGTDVCTAWVGGCPFEPVYLGEIQCRCLGASLHAYDENGQPIINAVGEMVINKPMPSMPIYFWNDEKMKRYTSSYFEMYEGQWRHGDWVKVTDRGTLIIYGRSDATLNRGGVRIGTAEIYRAINKIDEIADSLIVNIDLEGGRDYMPLFVVLGEGKTLNDDLLLKVKKTLRTECSPRHVPDEVIEIKEVPYTISGKKLEAPVKKILMGVDVEIAAKKDSMKNPGALEFFIEFGKGLDQ